MREVHVAGAFVTPFGRYPDTPLRNLASAAAAGALADAGGTPEDVDAVLFSNCSEGALRGQHAIRGQVALQDSGLLGASIANVENACASGSTGVNLAFAQIAAGLADVAIVVGADKLAHPDKARTFAAFASGLDVERHGTGENGAAQSVFMDVYASIGRDYMARTGATAEDFASVSVKSHRHGALNPNAQYRDQLTVEQVLESRPISDPLTLLMCSPIGDGAAALVLASDDGLARLDADPVRVLASVLRSGTIERPEGAPGAVERAAAAAYRMAGVTPGDVDVVEVHDAAAPGELVACEEIGIAPPGGAVTMLRAGETSLGGRVPVNPSGGLLSRGHPVGATGCAQLVELVDQLRGRCGERQVEGARVAIAENGGGWLGKDVAVAAITIVGRP